MLADYSRDEAKAFAKEHMEGIYSAIPVPETEDFEIDEGGLRHNVRHCIDVLGSAGIYVHGFYGNYWLLTSEERRRVTEIVTEEVGDTALVISRCGHASLKEAIELVRHSEEVGADIISMVGPQFGGTSESTVVDYFEAFAKETRLGISVFNTPYAGYVMSPELMARLAEIPNVVALKNAVPLEHTIRIRELVGEQLLVVDPSEERAIVNLLQFGQRFIYTNTNFMYDTAKSRPMRDYFDEALDGNAATAAKRYYEMQPLRDLHHKWIRGGWNEWGQCPVSTVKTWVEQLGMRGGASRPPLPRLSPEQSEQMIAEMAEVGLGD